MREPSGYEKPRRRALLGALYGKEKKKKQKTDMNRNLDKHR